MKQEDKRQYVATQCIKEAIHDIESDIPFAVKKHIKEAYWAAFAMGCIGLIYSLVVGVFSICLIGISGSTAAIFGLCMIALGIGIVRKSRLCAVLALLTWIGSSIYVANTEYGIYIILLFGYYLIMGIEGIFRYHRLCAKNGIPLSRL